jgi:hypothetical protein
MCFSLSYGELELSAALFQHRRVLVDPFQSGPAALEVLATPVFCFGSGVLI